MLSKKVLISGHVQGVSFRFHTVEEASKLGIKGWVRNLKDGRVEMLITGTPQDADNIAKLIKWAHHGPSGAKVEKIEVTETKEVSTEEFFIRRD